MWVQEKWNAGRFFPPTPSGQMLVAPRMSLARIEYVSIIPGLKPKAPRAAGCTGAVLCPRLLDSLMLVREQHGTMMAYSWQLTATGWLQRCFCFFLLSSHTCVVFFFKFLAKISARHIPRSVRLVFSITSLHRVVSALPRVCSSSALTFTVRSLDAYFLWRTSCKTALSVFISSSLLRNWLDLFN